jgi:hypothetical protein
VTSEYSSPAMAVTSLLLVCADDTNVFVLATIAF